MYVVRVCVREVPVCIVVELFFVRIYKYLTEIYRTLVGTTYNG